VCVDHGGPNVFVTEKFLYGAYIVTIVEKMGGERMTQGMAAAVLVDAGGGYGLLYSALDGRLADVMTPGFARARVDGGVFGRKQVLQPHCLAALGYLHSSA